MSIVSLPVVGTNKIIQDFLFTLYWVSPLYSDCPVTYSVRLVIKYNQNTLSICHFMFARFAGTCSLYSDFLQCHRYLSHKMLIQSFFKESSHLSIIKRTKKVLSVRIWFQTDYCFSIISPNSIAHFGSDMVYNIYLLLEFIVPKYCNY